MYKKVTEDLVKGKVAELLKERHWRKICLLIVLLPKHNKLISKYFIYNKIKDWEFWNPPYNQGITAIAKHRLAMLSIISRALNNLFLDGCIRKEDLGRDSLPQKEFEKICENRVLGRPEKQEFKPSYRWLQSAYNLFPKGRKKARSILFPPRKKRVSIDPRRRKLGGNQNCTRA